MGLLPTQYMPMAKEVVLKRRAFYVDERSLRRAKKTLGLATDAEVVREAIDEIGRDGGVLGIHEGEPRESSSPGVWRLRSLPWAILDTNVYVGHWEGGRYDDVLAEVRRAFVVRQSAIVLSELRRGARTGTARTLVDNLRERATVVWAPQTADWWEAGRLIRELGGARSWDRSKRRDFQNDALIALTARRHGATVVTANRTEFELLSEKTGASPLDLDIPDICLVSFPSCRQRPPGETRARVLEYVQKRLLEGRPPTIREVQRAFRFRAVETARAHLEALVREGRLSKREGESRGFELPLPARLPSSPGSFPSSDGCRPECSRPRSRISRAMSRSRAGLPTKSSPLRVRGESMIGAGIFPGRSRPREAAGYGALGRDRGGARGGRGHGKASPNFPQPDSSFIRRTRCFEVIVPKRGECRILGKVIEVRRLIGPIE